LRRSREGPTLRIDGDRCRRPRWKGSG
jgi:hypothetical protein